MKTWPVAFVAAWGVVLPSAAASASTSHAVALDDGSPPPTECVEASETEHSSRDDTLIVTLSNECTVQVRCTIEWIVECKNGEKHEGHGAATLGAGARKSFEATARMCSESGWRISPPTWSCASS